MKIGEVFQIEDVSLKCEKEGAYQLCHNEEGKPCHFFINGSCTALWKKVPSCNSADTGVNVCFIKQEVKK